LLKAGARSQSRSHNAHLVGAPPGLRAAGTFADVFDNPTKDGKWEHTAVSVGAQKESS